MSEAKRARFSVLYSNAGVDLALDPILLRGKVVDYLGGRADELEFQVEDRNGQMRSRYWPQKGDDVSVNLGWQDGMMFGAGAFVLDEAQVDGPPWTVTVRGLSRSVKKPLRQKNHRGFENTTLKTLLKQLSGDLGMLPDIQIDRDIPLERVTQHGEADLGFLHRLCWKFGVVVKVVSPGQIRFVDLEKLLDLDAMVLVTPENVKHLSLRSKTDTAPRTFVTRYFDPNAKAFLGQITKPRVLPMSLVPPLPHLAGVFARNFLPGDRSGSQDVGKLLDRVENLTQADRRAQLALLHAQMGQLEGNLTLTWHPELRAGVNIYLEGFGGAADGMYSINRAEQRIEFGGYETELDIAANPRNATHPKNAKPGAPLNKKLTVGGRR